MAKKDRQYKDIQTIVKFIAPYSLKQSLSSSAHERNISLSALLRIITTEYTKRNNEK